MNNQDSNDGNKNQSDPNRKHNNNTGGRVRFKHSFKESDIPEDKVFETRDEQGPNNKKAQFEDTVRALESFVQTQFAAKEGQVLILHMLREDTEDFSPTRPSIHSGATKEEIEDYQVELSDWRKAKSGLKNGRERLVGTITRLCSPGMIAKLETQRDYVKLRREGNFVVILKMIRRISTAFEEHVQHAASLAYHIHTFFNVFQSAREDLHEFVKNFKAHRDTIADFGGSLGVHPSMVAAILKLSIEDYRRPDGAFWQQAKDEALALSSKGRSYEEGVDEAFKCFTEALQQVLDAESMAGEEFAAMMLLRKANREKYKSLLRSLQDDRARGTDNYPKTVAEALHLLSSHRPHETRSVTQRPNNKGTQQTGLVQVGYQFSNVNQPMETSTEILDPNWILLDTGSTAHLFQNEKLLHSVKSEPTGNGIEVFCNAGKVATNRKGMFGEGIEEVWVEPKAIANVFSFSKLVNDGIDVSYDQARRHFVLKLPQAPDMVFKYCTPGLYVYDNNLKPTITPYCFLNTVSERLSSLSRTRQRKLKQAQHVYENLGFPTSRNFLRIIDHDVIPDLPIKRQAAKDYLYVYGEHEAALQGKTKKRTVPHIDSYNSVPIDPDILEHHHDVTLCVDVFFVDGLAFLLSVSRDIRYYNIVSLDGTKAKTDLKPELDRIRNIYAVRGFTVVRIHADGQFKSLVDAFANEQVFLYICPPHGHVPEAERGIQTAKERCRCRQAILPYKFYPKLLKQYVVTSGALSMNMLPHPDGVSPTLSPRTIVTGQKTSYNAHCKVSVGSYCQFPTYPQRTNTMEPRTTAGIALGPDPQHPSHFLFLSLETGKQISRHQFRQLPITDEIINKVHALASVDDSTQEPPAPDPFLFEWAPHVPILDFPSLTAPVGADQTAQHPPNNGNDDSNDNDDASYNSRDADNDAQPNDDDLDNDVDTDEEDEDYTNEDADNEVEEGDDNLNNSEDDNVRDDATEHEVDEQFYEYNDSTFINTPVRSNNAQDNRGNIGAQPKTTENVGAEQETTETLGAQQNTLGNPEAQENTANDDEQLDSNSNNTRSTRGNPNLFDPTTSGETGDDTLRRELRRLGDHNAPPTAHNMLQITSTPLEFELRKTTWTSRMNKALQVVLRREDLNKVLWDQKAATRGIVNILHSHMDVMLTQMTAKKGIRLFGEDAVTAIIKEFQQIDSKDVIIPRRFEDLTENDLKHTLRTITLVKEKRDGTVKGRMVADGRPQKHWYHGKSYYAPTVSTEGFMLSCAIDAKERRCTAACDVTGAYLNANMRDTVIIVLEGSMVDYMITANPDYAKYVYVDKNGKKKLYLQLAKALYGCIQSALLWWQTLYGTLYEQGFRLNPYDNCIANKVLDDGTQCTVCWYVDDLKISHAREEVVDEVITLIEKEYGKLQVQKGPRFEYLGMQIEYTNDGEVKIGMLSYIDDAIDCFNEALGTSARTPAGEGLFKVTKSEQLPEAKRKVFHSCVAKLLYLGKHGRPDILLPVSYLTSRTTLATRSDWEKLRRVLSYLKGTKQLLLTLSIDNLTVVKTWVDASFAVHEDMKSHTGGVIMMGKGALFASSKRQKINTKSSIEAELVGAGDILPQTIWTNHFLDAQGYNVEESRFFQDNESTMKLERNGRSSAGQRSRHINIRYFFIKDRIEKGEINLIYCNTKDMLADYFTKPLQGSVFTRFRDVIMGSSNMDDTKSLDPTCATVPQERVEKGFSGRDFDEPSEAPARVEQAIKEQAISDSSRKKISWSDIVRKGT